MLAATKSTNGGVISDSFSAELSFRLNGDSHIVVVEPRTTLLDLLRDRLRLTGTKIGCDGFQRGFCTCGQIISAIACIREGHATNIEEIREWMSGNLCRCGAYPNIAAAVYRVSREQ